MTPQTPHLLTPFRLGDLELRNRVVLAPMTRARAGAERTANALMAEYFVQRANAVLVYLVAGGLERDRFDTIGYGSSKPVASNDDEDGRARNRRIEFTALLDVQEGDQ